MASANPPAYVANVFNTVLFQASQFIQNLIVGYLQTSNLSAVTASILGVLTVYGAASFQSPVTFANETRAEQLSFANYIGLPFGWATGYIGAIRSNYLGNLELDFWNIAGSAGPNQRAFSFRKLLSASTETELAHIRNNGNFNAVGDISGASGTFTGAVSGSNIPAGGIAPTTNAVFTNTVQLPLTYINGTSGASPNTFPVNTYGLLTANRSSGDGELDFITAFSAGGSGRAAAWYVCTNTTTNTTNEILTLMKDGTLYGPGIVSLQNQMGKGIVADMGTFSVTTGRTYTLAPWTLPRDSVFGTSGVGTVLTITLPVVTVANDGLEWSLGRTTIGGSSTMTIIALTAGATSNLSISMYMHTAPGLQPAGTWSFVGSGSLNDMIKFRVINGVWNAYA